MDKKRFTPEQQAVRDLIDKHGWAFEMVASRLGASFSTIRNWYFGRTIPLRSFRRAIDDLQKGERRAERLAEKNPKV